MKKRVKKTLRSLMVFIMSLTMLLGILPSLGVGMLVAQATEEPGVTNPNTGVREISVSNWTELNEAIQFGMNNPLQLVNIHIIPPNEITVVASALNPFVIPSNVWLFIESGATLNAQGQNRTVINYGALHVFGRFNFNQGNFHTRPGGASVLHGTGHLSGPEHHFAAGGGIIARGHWSVIFRAAPGVFADGASQRIVLIDQTNPSPVEEPDDPPIRTGFTFEGWLFGGSVWDFDEVIEESKELIASWAFIECDTLCEKGCAGYGECGEPCKCDCDCCPEEG